MYLPWIPQKLTSLNQNHNFVILAWLDQIFPEGQHTVGHFSYTADQFYYLSQIEFLLNRHAENPKVLTDTPSLLWFMSYLRCTIELITFESFLFVQATDTCIYLPEAKVLGLWSWNNLASFKIGSDYIFAQNSFQTQHLGLDLEVDWFLT